MASADTSEAPVLKVENLRTYFRTRWGEVKAVDGVSFELRKGETLGIVGESGSGKTTAARAILKVEQTTFGEILWKGKELRSLDHDDLLAYRAAVQAVFQDPFSSMNPRVRVGDFVTEPLLLNRRSVSPSVSPCATRTYGGTISAWSHSV